ncbi:hypothetical protein ACTP13_14730 [Paenibacillus peoriae]
MDVKILGFTTKNRAIRAVPASSSLAIHSASQASVLRPGTFLIRWALASV